MHRYGILSRVFHGMYMEFHFYTAMEYGIVWSFILMHANGSSWKSTDFTKKSMEILRIFPPDLLYEIPWKPIRIGGFYILKIVKISCQFVHLLKTQGIQWEPSDFRSLVSIEFHMGKAQ